MFYLYIMVDFRFLKLTQALLNINNLFLHNKKI